MRIIIFQSPSESLLFNLTIQERNFLLTLMNGGGRDVISIKISAKDHLNIYLKLISTFR